MQTLAGPGVAASASRNARTPAITFPSNVVSRSVALRTAASSASAAASNAARNASCLLANSS